MSELETAADTAADEIVTSTETAAPEQSDDAQDGQNAPTPAAEEAAAEEKTRSQIRREERKEAERRRDEEAAETSRRLKESEAKLAKLRAAAGSKEAPKAADFENQADFLVAALAHQQAMLIQNGKVAEITDEIDTMKQAQEIARVQRLQDRQTSFREGFPDARAKYSDFDAALKVAADPNVVSQALSEAILESDASLDLAYHLGKNPALATRLSKMDPVQQAREIGRIEATLAAPKPQTRAPAPISPVKATAPATKDPNAMTADEFDQWRRSGGTFSL